jgi:ATP-dependent Clp protease protease subunit
MRFALTNIEDETIDIYISSFGGSVNKGFEIANLIQGIQAAGEKEIHTHILSHADSIATVIMLAAKPENRHVVSNSTFFVHDPRFIVFDEVTKQDAEKMANELEIQKNRIADYYVKNIKGLDKDEALSLMANETNLTAEKMLELGIVNEIQESFDIAAQRNLISNQNKNQMSLFKKEPKAINVIAMKDGSFLLHEGELKVGAIVQNAGEIVDLEAENETIEGKIITIDVDNKIIEIKEADDAGSDGDEGADDANDDKVVDEVAEILAKFEEKITALMDSKIEAIKKTGSKAKVPKTEPKEGEIIKGTQASAGAGIRERMKKIQAEKRKRQGIN